MVVSVSYDSCRRSSFVVVVAVLVVVATVAVFFWVVRVAKAGTKMRFGEKHMGGSNITD